MMPVLLFSAILRGAILHSRLIRSVEGRSTKIRFNGRRLNAIRDKNDSLH